MTGDLLGTLRYMSTQQALAQRVTVDGRTDIYSLGATLYELVTLQPIFTGKGRPELLHQIAFDEPVPPRKHNRNIPTELETIILKSLAKTPHERYATAQELSDDLRRFLTDQPIKAKAPGFLLRTRRWARRHKGVVASIAALALIFALGVAASAGWLLRDQAVQEAIQAKGDALRALEQERRAKLEAQEQEVITNSILEFVEKQVIMVALPQNRGGLGHNVQLGEAVKAALPFVDMSFKNRSLIEAKLRGTLSKVLGHLDEYRLAAKQAEVALHLISKYRGPKHPVNLLCMY